MRNKTANMIEKIRNANDLLTEIKKHRIDNEKCDVAYWNNLYTTLSESEKDKLGDFWRELKYRNLIYISWASGEIYSLKIEKDFD